MVVQGMVVQGTEVEGMVGVVELTVATLVLVEVLVEVVLSAVHAECHAVVAVAVAACPTLAMVRVHMSRRLRTSTWVVVAISMS